MTSFLRERKSVREFKAVDVKNQLLDDIEDYLRLLETEDGSGDFRFVFYKDGKRLFDGLNGIGGYSGVMIQSPHYVALEIMNSQDKSIINGAYFMEKLITKLNSMGLDTCWVSIGDVNHGEKVKLFDNLLGNINYLLAFGHRKPRNPFEEVPFSNRIGLDEFVYMDESGKKATLEDLENRGLDDLFYYLRYAPSSFNRQPWRFLLKKEKVALIMECIGDKDSNLIDAGVIMYYFEELGKAIGINSKWELANSRQNIEDREYRIIGEIVL